MKPLAMLIGIAAVLIGLTLVTPFAFTTFGDNAYIALTILAGLLTIAATRVGTVAMRSVLATMNGTTRKSGTATATRRVRPARASASSTMLPGVPRGATITWFALA